MVQLDTGVVLKKIPILAGGDYRAGSDGRIYSRLGSNGRKGTRGAGWRPLAGSKRRSGLKRVTVSCKGHRFYYSVHRLVCMAFHGEPNIEQQPRHINGDLSNNRPENLCWSVRDVKLRHADLDFLRWALDVGLCDRRHAARVFGLSEADMMEALARAEA